MKPTIQGLLALACGAVLLAGSARADVYCECLPSNSPCGNWAVGTLPGGCTNSAGKRAYLGPIGTLSVSIDDLILSSFSMPPLVPTVLLMGAGSTNLPFGDGLLCVTAGTKGLYSFPIQLSGATGAVASGPGLAHLAKSSFPAAGWIHAGDTWHFQRWYRDPQGPCGSGFNLSNALALTFVP